MVKLEPTEVISRGQITLPKVKLDNHNIEQGDYVEIELRCDDLRIYRGARLIGESGRVTIPKSTRKIHGIKRGDSVRGNLFKL